MRKFLYITAFLCLVFGAIPAQADKAYITARDLLTSCPPNSDKISCQWYIAGIIDYHNVVRSVKNAPAVDFCIPNGISLAVVTDKVLYYLAQSPQHDNFIASPAVTLALNKVYPCS